MSLILSLKVVVALIPRNAVYRNFVSEGFLLLLTWEYPTSDSGSVKVQEGPARSSLLNQLGDYYV